MPENVAALLVKGILAYLGLGLGFAAIFAWRWAGRLDPGALAGTPGFRVLVLPGATLLWPGLVIRLLRGGRGRSS